MSTKLLLINEDLTTMKIVISSRNLAFGGNYICNKYNENFLDNILQPYLGNLNCPSSEPSSPNDERTLPLTSKTCIL